MPKKSTKENKSVYQLAREELGLTRQEASDELKVITPERLERIENEKTDISPYDVLTMSEVYGKPDLCNYYCSHTCDIGKQYVPEVKIKDLSQIVLEMLASLNRIQDSKNRLIEITVDGTIDDKELKEFIEIQNELEKISITVETLRLWAEKMIADGVIDKDKYEQMKSQ